MEIRVLKYFITVVEEEGISRAADVLHITQPTLSRQLAALESEMGVKLFERGSRKLTLTTEGLLLKRRAQEILSLVNKTEKELTEQEKLVEGKITIGCGELDAIKTLSKIMKDYHDYYPLVEFDMFTANADVVKDQMEKGLVDIGVLLEPIDMEKFDFVRLKDKEEWVVLMRADDELAGKSAVAAKDLEGRDVILPRRENVKNEVANWFGSSYDKINVVAASNLSTNSAIMVENGFGYSILIKGSVPHIDEERIVVRDFSPRLTTTSVFAWKKNQTMSLATRKFIEAIHAFKA